MVSLIYLERSKNKKNISKKTNKLEDQADVEGSVSASSLVLKPLLVFSEQENILADSKPHLDSDQTPQADFLLITTTTSRNTATRSSKRPSIRNSSAATLYHLRPNPKSKSKKE